MGLNDGSLSHAPLPIVVITRILVPYSSSETLYRLSLSPYHPKTLALGALRAFIKPLTVHSVETPTEQCFQRSSSSNGTGKPSSSRGIFGVLVRMVHPRGQLIVQLIECSGSSWLLSPLHDNGVYCSTSWLDGGPVSSFSCDYVYCVLDHHLEV